MKLSTAIRIGSMTTRQIKGIWDDGDNGRCALGAACDAVNYRTVHMGRMSYLLDSNIAELFPILSHDVYITSSIGILTLGMMSLGWYITRLNDSYGISREKIADYVESIENELEKQTTTVKEKEYATH